MSEDLSYLKPKTCKLCYFWHSKSGCELGEGGCYYRPRVKEKRSECDGCPYGRDSPCIGWCTKKLMRELGL